MIFDFHNLLAKGLEALDVDISSGQYDQLHVYFMELKKWNRKINLVAKKTTDSMLVENHFLDSLVLLSILDMSGVRLLDIGTGAGFPGLVCKVVMPEMAVTLVEPKFKKVSFLKHIIRTLDLTNVRVLACRVEDDDVLESVKDYSHITSRAVTDVGAFLEMVKKFSSSRPRVICMKGPRWKEEVKEISNSPYVLSDVKEYTLPFSGARRSLLFYEIK